MFLGARAMTGLVAAVFAAVAAAGQSGGQDFRQEAMASAGFTPVAEMAFGGRDVHRVLPIDPYGMLPIPGIELERHSDGRLTLRAQYRGWVGPAYSVSPDEWRRVAALESAAYGPLRKATHTIPPGVVIHCWSGLISATPDKSASWSACDDSAQAAQDYSLAVLDLAMRKMACPPSDKDPLWRFSAFTAAASQLDDAVLAQQLSVLRERWRVQREPGSDILAKARTALRVAHDAPSPATIKTARDAVLAFRRQQDALRTVVQGSFGLVGSGAPRSAKEIAIIDQTRAGWNDDIMAQSRNYIVLLEDLAKLQSIPVKQWP